MFSSRQALEMCFTARIFFSVNAVPFITAAIEDLLVNHDSITLNKQKYGNDKVA